MKLQEDGVMEVKETLDVYFHKLCHGIFREIPFRYGDDANIDIYEITVPNHEYTVNTIGNYKAPYEVYHETKKAYI